MVGEKDVKEGGKMKRLLRRLAMYVFIVLFGSGCLWVTWNVIYPGAEYVGYWKLVPWVAIVIGLAFLVDSVKGYSPPIDDDTLDKYRGRK